MRKYGVVADALRLHRGVRRAVESHREWPLGDSVICLGETLPREKGPT
jgi:hypothetical protein